MLRRLGDGLDGATISVGHIADRLGPRAFGLLILVASLPMLIPNLPGVSTVFGILILVPALQIAIGRRRIRLPRRLRRVTVPTRTMRTVIEKSVPYVEKAERLLRPRLRALTRGAGLNAAGVLMVLLGIVMALPIPFGNSPPAAACALIAVGVLSRDGLFVALGAVVGIAALAFAGSIVYGFFFVTAAVVG
ncbi:MAG: exopolysaccharide biosynthesis protein [Gemmatimonas sp.]